MASDDGSFITNPFPEDSAPALPTWGGFGDYGTIPSAPATDLISSAASVGLGSQKEAEPRVATPGTRARQQEMGRLVMLERQRYMENANASQAGSVMELHMNGYMRGLEHGTTLNASLQGGSIESPIATDSVNNNASYLNLHGGLLNDERHTQVEQGCDLTDKINPADNQAQVHDITCHIQFNNEEYHFNNDASLGKGSNVEEPDSQANQTGSTTCRQPTFEAVAYPATCNHPSQNTFVQNGRPEFGNLYAQPTVDRMGVPSFTSGRSQFYPSYANGPGQANIGRFNQPSSTNARRQADLARLGEPRAIFDQGVNNIGRPNQPTLANRRRYHEFVVFGNPSNPNDESWRHEDINTYGRDQFNDSRLNRSTSRLAQRLNNIGNPTNRRRQLDVGRLARLGQPTLAIVQERSHTNSLQQSALSNNQALTADQPGIILRTVNFTTGIFGRITQIEQTIHEAGDEGPIVTSAGLNSHPTYITANDATARIFNGLNGLPDNTGDERLVVTSAGPNSCDPPAYVTSNDATAGLTNGLNGHAYNTRNGSDISEGSSTSTLRRRAGVNDLTGSARQQETQVGSLDQVPNHENDVNAANEAPNMPRVSMIMTSGTTPQGDRLLPLYNQNVTIESAPVAAPAVPQPATITAQAVPNVANPNPAAAAAAAHVPAQNDGPPAVLNLNDGFGLNIVTAMHAVARLRNCILALGGDAEATEVVVRDFDVITYNFVLGQQRSNAIIRNGNEEHRLTRGLLNEARLGARAIGGQYQRTLGAVERAEERAGVMGERMAAAEREREVVFAELVAANRALARSGARGAQLEERLAERREAAERLQAEAEQVEELLFGGQ